LELEEMIAMDASPPAIHFTIPAPPPAPVIDYDRVLRVILQLEGHSWSSRGGALAWQPKSWGEDTTLPFSLVHEPEHAIAVAKKRFVRFAGIAAKSRVTWTPRLAIESWRWGIAEAIYREQRHLPSGYGLRGYNLFHDPAFK
jgi:hypothetical protein